MSGLKEQKTENKEHKLKIKELYYNTENDLLIYLTSTGGESSSALRVRTDSACSYKKIINNGQVGGSRVTATTAEGRIYLQLQAKSV